MNKFIPLILMTCVLAPIEVSYAQQYYCPNSWTPVAIGSSESVVEQLCGSPTNKTESREALSETHPVEQYFYTVSYGSTNANEFFTGRNAIANQQQRYDRGVDAILGQSSNTGLNTQVNLVVTVIENQVNNIRIDNQDVTSTTLCQDNIQVQVGDPVSTLLQACGDPSLVNRTTQSFQTGEVSDINTWVYDNSPYQPTSVFKFAGGTLAEVQQ